MKKNYFSGKELEKQVRESIGGIARLVGETLGPGGRPVLLKRENDTPQATKDGVTVARAYATNGGIDELVVEAAREVCERSARNAGDGPQPLHSKVLTPTGFVKMGDMKVGMEICGTNGTIQRVLGVFPKGKKEIYEVELENSGIVECCGDHIWNVVVAQNNCKSANITTESMVKDFVKVNAYGEKKHKYFAPRTYVDFYETELPIDPYLLGVSIGLDNSSSKTKFIPTSYLYSSKKTREALLKGLIDTDGYVNSRGLFEFSTVSDKLANDFVELARGLGKSVYRRLHVRAADSGSYSDIPIHRIQELKGYKYGSKIVRISPTGKYAEMQCVKVSNPDSLYITDNYAVTHNTTTAIVLASALVSAGQDAIGSRSPQAFARELKIAYETKVKPDIESLAKPIKGLTEAQGLEMVKKVALVSANHDSGIADAVAEATQAVGDDGVIEVEEGTGRDIRVSVRDGYAFNSGLNALGGSAGPSFVNRQASGDCAIDNVLVALYDGEINETGVVVPLLERVVADPQKPSLLILAHAFSDQVLKALAQNFRRGVVTVVPMKTPRGGHGPSEALRDIAAFTGGLVFDSQGIPLSAATIETLGFVASVRIDQRETRLVGKPAIEDLEKRISELKSRLEGATEFDAGQLRFRIGRLTSGVATLYAGGSTAFEAMERRDRAVDAVSAVRCAIDSGVVPGGGASLLFAARKLSDSGAEGVLKKALQEPFKRILENAGVEWVGRADSETGYVEDQFMVIDALSLRAVEWWSAGIMDPLKVTLGALENAISVAQMLITLGGAVSDNPTESETQVKALQNGIMKAVEGQ
jgi:chaperonin GroEL